MDGPISTIVDVASPSTDAGQTRSNVVDHVAPLETVSAHSVDAEEMEAQSEPVVESEPVSSPLSGAANPPNLVAESTVDCVSHISSDPLCNLYPPQEIPLPAEGPMDEASFSDIEPLKLCDLLYDLESDHSGSDVDSLSVASTKLVVQSFLHKVFSLSASWSRVVQRSNIKS